MNIQIEIEKHDSGAGIPIVRGDKPSWCTVSRLTAPFMLSVCSFRSPQFSRAWVQHFVVQDRSILSSSSGNAVPVAAKLNLSEKLKPDSWS
jgi:hypothetical protein